MLMIKPYTGDAAQWDDFVLNQSFNGTFLHSKRFLDYHPSDRFQDMSLIIHKHDDPHDVYAMIPGCTVAQDGHKIFYSHKGSTFGSPVIHKIRYTASDVMEIFEELEKYLREEGYDRIIYKLTPDIFCSQSTDLVQYLLSYYGYQEYTELSTYIDYNEVLNDNIIDHISNRHRRRRIRKCEKDGMSFRVLETDQEIAEFYELLYNSLARFNVRPVHTVEELLEFKHRRLNDIVNFYGVFLAGKIIGASMSFCFNNCSVFHIQYSATDPDYNNLSPMSYLFYGLLCEGYMNHFSKLSWGISTENCGKYLNKNLLETKESYGSHFTLNRTFTKDLI